MARRFEADTLGLAGLPFDLDYKERAHLDYIQTRILLSVFRAQWRRYKRLYGMSPSIADYRFIAASTRIQLRATGLGGCVWLLDQGMVVSRNDVLKAIDWLKATKIDKYASTL